MGNTQSNVEQKPITIEKFKNAIFGAVLVELITEFDNQVPFEDLDNCLDSYCLPCLQPEKDQNSLSDIELLFNYYGSMGTLNTQSAMDAAIERYVEKYLVNDKQNYGRFYRLLIERLRPSDKVIIPKCEISEDSESIIFMSERGSEGEKGKRKEISKVTAPKSKFLEDIETPSVLQRVDTGSTTNGPSLSSALSSINTSSKKLLKNLNKKKHSPQDISTQHDVSNKQEISAETATSNQEVTVDIKQEPVTPSTVDLPTPVEQEVLAVPTDSPTPVQQEVPAAPTDSPTPIQQEVPAATADSPVPVQQEVPVDSTDTTAAQAAQAVQAAQAAQEMVDSMAEKEVSVDSTVDKVDNSVDQRMLDIARIINGNRIARMAAKKAANKNKSVEKKMQSVKDYAEDLLSASAGAEDSEFPPMEIEPDDKYNVYDYNEEELISNNEL